jgi:hypothetical protein
MIFLLADFPTKNILNKLLAKWTMAVAPTATGTGKNMANTGVKIVPNPKPENRVNPDATSATVQRIKYSTR